MEHFFLFLEQKQSETKTEEELFRCDNLLLSVWMSEQSPTTDIRHCIRFYSRSSELQHWWWASERYEKAADMFKLSALNSRPSC